MNLEFITDYINKKLAENDEYICITFYELRVKNNLTEEETNLFLNFSKIRLENMKYKVYFTGQEYIYKNSSKVVQRNELLVAIK